MTTGSDLRRDNLGSRLDEARRRHERCVLAELHRGNRLPPFSTTGTKKSMRETK